MDIFDIHNIKSEKDTAILHYHRFKKLAKLFRLVEVLLAVVLLSWVSSRLPFVVRISGEYFRQLITIIVSPLFIFFIGNIIVLTLVVKSGGNLLDINITGTDLYEEIVNSDVPPVLEPEEVVYQDKQMICEVNTKPDLGLKAYKRSQSEKMVKVDKKLKRSVTEIGHRKVDIIPVEEKKQDDVVEELSNEEFQRRIEGFIARQVRFHQQEK
ncbi:uncharacterized protein LOC143637120 [Bidens hawaiensis]|uniref:uncharacterized protein LOC143637120 n=1 Tax=Bidens hawaiensis TaxID=980011 RepID=UPI00404AC906